jgi:hypothetical protein
MWVLGANCCTADLADPSGVIGLSSQLGRRAEPRERLEVGVANAVDLA